MEYTQKKENYIEAYHSEQFSKTNDRSKVLKVAKGKKTLYIEE
jgi:hypothetical protein